MPSDDTIPKAPKAVQQLCDELGRQAREFYPERDWAAVEPILRRIWTREQREIDWDTARALIRSVWSERR